MSKTQRTRGNNSDGVSGFLVRPLDSLFFLLPLIVFYQFSMVFQPTVVVAYDLLRQSLQTLGHFGIWAPGAAIAIILLATQIASGQSWRIRWRRVFWMYPEAVVTAVPLLFLGWASSLSAAPAADPLVSQLAVGIGAGVYEELVFRLILISLIVVIGADLLKFRAGAVAVVAIVVSSLLFSAHHHRPLGSEPFALVPFAFRTIAGVYLAVVFWFRGYGAAAGAHAAYNTMILLYATMRGI